MNGLIFEGRFLVNVTSTLIRQDSLRVSHNRIDWERMFRIADYHKLANLIYLGILGNGEAVPERWQNRFFERYQEALLYGEICEEGESEILSMLDMMELPCLVLASCGVRELYQMPETAANCPLSLYFDSNSYILAKGYLVDLGYETETSFTGFGERMKRPSGFRVELYHKLPFSTHLYEKNMMGLVESAVIKSPYQHVRAMTPESRFVFRMAQSVYRYVTDELLIREVLDLYLYHKAWREQMNQEFIQRKLAELRIDELSHKILRIAYMWFGTKEENRLEEQPEDMAVYDMLENRILSRGAIKKEQDKQALFLAHLIQKEKDKDKRKKEWESLKKQYKKGWEVISRKVRWFFPEYKYMCAIYPSLDRIPILLPVCWLRRGFRLLGGLLFKRRKKNVDS